ncbi:MAG: hypothetical protein RL846_11125 [Deltaproteobacteria bacterium]
MSCALLLVAMPHVGGKVAVFDVQATDVREALLPILTEVLTTEVANARVFDEVLAGRDVQQMLSFEEKKQMVGCDDTSCLAEIGGALGVDRLIVPQIARVSASWIVTLKQIDIRGASTEGRVYDTFEGDEGALLAGVRSSVVRLLGGAPVASTLTTTAPESSFPIVPVALWSTAAVSAGVGVALALKAKGHEDNAYDPSFVGAQHEIERSRDAALGATVALATAGALAVGGALAWWLTGDDVSAGVTANEGGAHAVVAGRF